LLSKAAADKVIKTIHNLQHRFIQSTIQFC
jgi:hypothetical protein